MNGGAARQNKTVQRNVERAIKAMQACGLEIGGVEFTGPESFRVLTKGETKADLFEDWKRKRAANVG